MLNLSSGCIYNHLIDRRDVPSLWNPGSNVNFRDMPRRRLHRKILWRVVYGNLDHVTVHGILSLVWYHFNEISMKVCDCVTVHHFTDVYDEPINHIRPSQGSKGAA